LQSTSNKKYLAENQKVKHEGTKEMNDEDERDFKLSSTWTE